MDGLAISWSLGLLVAELAWVIGLAGWMALERRSPTATLAWILGLAFLPFLGVPVYLFLGPRRLRRRKLRLLRARETVGRIQAAWEQNSAGQPPHRQQLMRLAFSLDGMPPSRVRGLQLLDGGDACFAAIEQAIRAARHHVHAEYYIFRPDRAGARIRDALVERAKAGLEVRLLVDALGSSSLGNDFLRPLREAGGRVLRFNRPLLGAFGKGLVNFRTHRKIVVVDGAVGFTGGINVCDDHSVAANGAAAWRDTHLRLEGDAVTGLQRTFLENWVFAGRDFGEPAIGTHLADYFPLPSGGERLAQVVAGGPDQETPAIEAWYLAAISAARERVWITTPYFVPEEPLFAALQGAALRGVDVQLVLPSRTDSFLVDAAGSTFHAQLQRAGVRIHRFGPPMVHAKTCVIDRDLAVVGTANLDSRSLRLNFEVVATIFDEGFAGELAALFERDRAASKEQPPGEPRASLPRRLLVSAARLLAPQL